MKKNTKNIYTIDTETGEGMIEMLNFFKKKLWEAAMIPTAYGPSTYSKNFNRRTKINKIINGTRHKSI